MCMLPATISNNVPGTDLSIGADTALNAIVEVRQSNRRQQSFERFVQDACAKTLNVRHDMKVQERKLWSSANTQQTVRLQKVLQYFLWI